MINILLCSDDDYYIQTLKELSDYLSFRMEYCQFEAEFAQHLDEYCKHANIIFMDMKTKAHFDVSIELRKRGYEGELILLADNNDYVFDIFEVRPMQYIEKGKTTRQCLARIFLYAVRKILKENNAAFIIKNRKALKVISALEVLYFQIHGGRLTVHLVNQKHHTFISSIKEFENKKGLIRVHRSCLVNVIHIKGIGPGPQLLLTSGDSLRIGSSYLPRVKKLVSFLESDNIL